MTKTNWIGVTKELGLIGSVMLTLVLLRAIALEGGKYAIANHLSFNSLFLQGLICVIAILFTAGLIFAIADNRSKVE